MTLAIYLKIADFLNLIKIARTKFQQQQLTINPTTAPLRSRVRDGIGESLLVFITK
jgi:hypothetical protein